MVDTTEMRRYSYRWKQHGDGVVDQVDEPRVERNRSSSTGEDRDDTENSTKKEHDVAEGTSVGKYLATVLRRRRTWDDARCI